MKKLTVLSKLADMNEVWLRFFGNVFFFLFLFFREKKTIADVLTIKGQAKGENDLQECVRFSSCERVFPEGKNVLQR